MQDEPKQRRWRSRSRIVAAILVGCAVAASAGVSLGAQSAASAAPIKIGVLTICGGAFAPFEAASFAGSKYPLIQRGGKLAGSKPQDGVSGVSIGGHPIKLYFGCSDATPDKAIAETRRLVEHVGVDILVGPLSGDEGIAVANYAKKQPGKTFINGSSAGQQTTLVVKAPNFFRYGGDGAQWMAGLGKYAYRTLHWRKAAILGEDYSYPWTQAAGFVTEFCSLGGNVTKRIWGAIGTADWSSFVTQIPRDVDGFLLLTGGTDTNQIEKAYSQFGGKLSQKMLGGSSVMDPSTFDVGDPLVGVIGSVPVPLGGTTKGWKAWQAKFSKVFPKAPADSVFSVNYANSMEAALKALEATKGDLSNGHKKLNAFLAKLTLNAPNGFIKLDKNRNAILSAYTVQVVKKNGKLGFKTLQEVKNVDETFAGNFSATSKPPGRNSPACKKGPVPPWAK